MDLHFELRYTNPQSGLQHKLLLENYKSFHQQCIQRSEWAYRTTVESKASQRVYWCTLTYDNEHLITEYDQCVNNSVGNINKYIPVEYKKEYDKYMQLDQIERNKYAKQRSFPNLYTELRAKYFYAARGWLPLAGQYVEYKGDKPAPLHKKDPIYYYTVGDFIDNYNDTYITRTGKELKGFNNFENGFRYSENDFIYTKLEECSKYCDLKQYDWHPSDNGLLCKEHISKFIRKWQKNFQDITTYRFRFLYQAEYGGAHHRPHYHLLVFVPNTVDTIFPESFFYDMIKDWQYGKVKEIKEIRTIDYLSIQKIVDYVGKHFVKWDKGNFWQQKMSPIFRQTSCYDGGIGYQLLDPGSTAFDQSEYDNLIALQGVTSPLSTINGFVHPQPRYYRRMIFPEFHHTDDMLNEFSNIALTQYYDDLFSNFFFQPQKFHTENFEIIKEFYTFVKNQDNYIQTCEYLTESLSLLTDEDITVSEPVNRLVQTFIRRKTVKDNLARERAKLRYIENKNKWRNSNDKLDFKYYLGDDNF